MINRGWIRNAILLGLLIGAAYSVEWLDQRTEAEKTAQEEAKTLAALTREEVTRLLFRDGAGVALELARDKEGWRITAPRAMRADSAMVEDLLSLPSRRFTRKVADKAGELAPYGLDPPQGEIAYHGDKGPLLALAVGAKTPASGDRYVRIDAGAVVMLPEAMALPLTRKSEELRDANLAQFRDLSALTEIHLEGGGKRLSFVNPEGKGWRMTAPWEDLASEMRLSGWFDLIATTRGQGFSDDAPKDPPTWSVRFVRKEGEESLALWKREGDLLAARPGEPDRMIVAATLARELEQDPLRFAELRPLAAEPPSIAFSLEGKEYKAEFKDKKWPAPAWTTLASTLLSEAWKAEKMEEKKDPPLLILAVGDKSVRVWKEEHSYLFAPSHRPVFLRLSNLQSRELDDALAALRGKTDKKAAAGEKKTDGAATDGQEKP